MLHVAFVNHHPRWSRTNEALHWSSFSFLGCADDRDPTTGTGQAANWDWRRRQDNLIYERRGPKLVTECFQMYFVLSCMESRVFWRVEGTESFFSFFFLSVSTDLIFCVQMCHAAQEMQVDEQTVACCEI